MTFQEKAAGLCFAGIFNGAARPSGSGGKGRMEVERGFQKAVRFADAQQHFSGDTKERRRWTG
jgi:hypothetical protein